MTRAGNCGSPNVRTVLWDVAKGFAVELSRGSRRVQSQVGRWRRLVVSVEAVETGAG